jgi:hypothetical protein
MSEVQRKLATYFPDLRDDDLRKLEEDALSRNTLRRIEKAITDEVRTRGYTPDFLNDLGYIGTIQQLVVEAVFGYWSQNQKAAGLKDTYGRVLEKIRIRRANSSWIWPVPSKRTVDRRVNECASNNARENHILDPKTGKPRIIQDHIDSNDSYYRPNPVMFEQAIKEAART